MLSLYYSYCVCYITDKMTMQFCLSTDHTDVVTTSTSNTVTNVENFLHFPQHTLVSSTETAAALRVPQADKTSQNSVTAAPGTRWFCLCFSTSVACCRTTLEPLPCHSSALWQSLWFLGLWAKRSSWSRCSGLLSPAVWNWCAACVFWTAPHQRTPSGSAGPSGSSVRLQPATSPTPASASEHS